MTSPKNTLAIQREAIARAAGRLAMLDFQLLLRLALLVDPLSLTVTASWEGLSLEVDVAPAILRPVVERLHDQGYLSGRIDVDGVHLHLDDFLDATSELPRNLPLEDCS